MTIANPFAFVLALILAGVALFAFGVAAGQPHQPYCPTEDSCVAVYDGGSHAWVIRPVTP